MPLRRAPLLPLLAAAALPGAHATPPAGFEVCLEAEACENQFDRLELSGGYFYNNTFPSKGCFRKNENLFFNGDGTEEEMAEADLPGVQERVWCAVATDPVIAGARGAENGAAVGGGGAGMVALLLAGAGAWAGLN